MRILVVDDDPLSRMLLVKILADLGHGAIEAADGFAAVEAATLESFDLVVTDWVMPGLTGGELIETLRGAGIGVPVWVATATDPGPGFETIGKPYDRAEIEMRLAQVTR